MPQAGWFDAAVLSKPGGRERNEDFCGQWASDAIGCYVVSDGAGGHGGGEFAAKVAVTEVLREFVLEPAVSVESMHRLLWTANRAVLDEQVRRLEFPDMRATIAVLCVDRERSLAIWGHAGDSRVYCFRDARMRHRTLDHSVVQELVGAGYCDESALRRHPDRSRLVSALGGRGELRASALESPVAIAQGDCFLLCTDGLWEYTEEAAMEKHLRAAADTGAWLAALEREVLATAPPGHDNYSALALRLGPMPKHDGVETLPFAIVQAPLARNA
jgi:serine/threonine protein phosphatase PrpC